MKKRLAFCLALLHIINISLAQDTFSIVAVDLSTGEVGSAGASCIEGVLRISDVHPGKGAIHTQASSNESNQDNARILMNAGYSPDTILAWLVANDVNTSPETRQYGIVDMDAQGQPRTAAFTGASALDWKGHILGPNYAIQGNILAGAHVLDSMESRFLNTPGPLSYRLMAALQGANFPGADIRCLDNGTSTLSSFIRVAKPADALDNFYLDITVPETPPHHEPIDSLQKLFDFWKGDCQLLHANFELAADTVTLTVFGAAINLADNSANAAIRTWDFGDGSQLTTEQTHLQHVYAQPGTYTVREIVQNQTCADTATAVVVVEEPMVLGVPGIGFPKRVLLFPNPFEESLQVEIEGLQPGMSFRVFNLFGALVLEKAQIDRKSFTFARGNLAAGLYFYQLSHKGMLLDQGKITIQ